jgi:hypothetical protein
MKVVINRCYGGFSLSNEALKLYEDLSGKKDVYGLDIERNDPILIDIIETLGIEKSNGGFAELKIVDIPDGIKYTICEYDGMEWVAEVHRTWK